MTDNCVIEREANTATPAGLTCRSGYRPSIDIVETANEFTVVADLPGVSSKDVSIEFDKGVLSLRATVAAREPAGAKVLARGYGVGDFAREFRIGEGIDMTRVTAECANGVLTLRLPKAEAAKPRKIEVK
jgi:HSP20 family protein